MSNFINDTLEIDKKIKVNTSNVKDGPFRAVVLPYYLHPESNDLIVVLKRSIMAGCHSRTGRKMGISALTAELPETSQLSIQEVYDTFGLGATMQNAIPFGSVMPNPKTSTEGYELVIVHIEPVEYIDENRKIIVQKKGEYEVGTVAFGDLIKAINDNMIQDTKTRLILNELYILVLEERANQQEGDGQNQNTMMEENDGMIGGGQNLPNGYGEQEDTMATSNIPEEVLEKNANKDYGAIYSRANPEKGFKTIEKE